MSSSFITMKEKKTYPQNRNEWLQAIQHGVGISGEEGKKVLLQGAFPIENLRNWIVNEFSDGFGQHFAPALLRNIHGLINWVYGNGNEPYWPGSDDDQAMQ